MKFTKYFMLACLCTTGITSITSCKKSDFADNFKDPGKLSSSTVEKQYTGITYSFRELVVPSYWNYFVILRSTAIRNVQATGWANETNQLAPGGASIQDRWNTFYAGLAQFRELEKIYNSLPTDEKESKKVFYLTAKIFFYDQTQQVVDLHGSIPWSEAGMLSTNGGDYTKSYARYETGEEIYTKMLDDLKLISADLNKLTIPSSVTASFKTQDLINSGDLNLWKKYCNSLRLRMLTRVSSSSSFSARANQELGEIISNQTTSPLVKTNAENIQIDIFNNASDINSRGLRDALESWNANISSKVMIDNMVSNSDPRLPFIFEPGAGAVGKFIGLDQSLPQAQQTALITGTPATPSTIAIYNRSTFSRNQNFPGVLITASEVNFLLAEYYTKNSKNAEAKTSFENGIKESIEFYKSIRTLSNDNTLAAPVAPTNEQIDAYIAKIGWGTNNLQLIATQRWLHFNILQPLQSWAEVKRLDYPKFTFRVESSDLQKTPPLKWNLPSTEVTYNATNYEAVKAQDNVNTKLFWDVN